MAHRQIKVWFFAAALTTALSGCESSGTLFPTFPEAAGSAGAAGGMGGAGVGIPPPVIRQPVLPEYLVGCRAHVLVPALGMTFVFKGAETPTSGQFLREDRLTAPYRVIKPGDRVSQDRSQQRQNVELDSYNRVVGLSCG